MKGNTSKEIMKNQLKLLLIPVVLYVASFLILQIIGDYYGEGVAYMLFMLGNISIPALLIWIPLSPYVKLKLMRLDKALKEEQQK